MDTTKDILLTPEEVAAITRVKPRTVRDWIRERKIVFVKLPGGDLRIRKENFDRWLEMRTVKPTP